MYEEDQHLDSSIAEWKLVYVLRALVGQAAPVAKLNNR
jgi:hypothetical protein